MTSAGPSSIARPEGKSAIGLDLLRGLAALEVVLTHTLYVSFVDYSDLPLDQQTTLVGVVMALMRLGHEAVLIFFVLSGYLVGGQVITRLQQGQFDLARYSVDRVSRIMLPLIPACLLTFAVAAWLTGALPALDVMLAHLFGLNGVVTATLETNKPLWSLPYEIWFYILAGALAVFATRRLHIGAAAALLAGLCVFSILDARFVLYWAIGAAVVLVRDDPRKGLYGLVGAGLAVAGLVLRQLPLMHLVEVELVPIAVSETIMAVGIALALPWLSGARANRLLAPFAAVAGFLSAVSFTLYLFHKPVLEVMHAIWPRAAAIGLDTVLMFGVRLGVVFAVVAVAWLMFELHTPRLRRWLWNQVQRRRTRENDVLSEPVREKG